MEFCRMAGPCLRGMRLTVRRVLEIAALYPKPAERRLEYPELEEEDIRQAPHYAALHLPDQILPLPDRALVARSGASPLCSEGTSLTWK